MPNYGTFRNKSQDGNCKTEHSKDSVYLFASNGLSSFGIASAITLMDKVTSFRLESIRGAGHVYLSLSLRQFRSSVEAECYEADW